MNEQDKKLVELYLHDVRKKRIIIFIIISIIFTCTIVSKLYVNHINQTKKMDNEVYIQEENNQNLLNEVTNNIDTIISQSISETTEENIQNDITVETEKTNEDEKTNIEKITNFPQSDNTSTSKTNEKKEEPKSQKPSQKDFLFTDGYSMENVSQVAQNYLKSSGFAGKCIPLKDNEGVYLGMRVVFY